MESIERSSSLPISAERAWARVVTEQGINDELAPWLRMTMPKRLRGIVGALFSHRHRRLRQIARTRASTMPR